MTCNTLPVPVAVGDEHIPLNFSSGSYTYSLSNRHRGRASDKKSTWTVNTTIEVELFEESMQKSYINNQLSWNIHSTYIGHDKDGSNVKLARFDSRNATNNEWHGYPVDYSKDPNNRPSKEILNEWVKRSIITNSEMIKILSGRKVKALL